MDESFYLMIKRDIEDVIKDIFSKYYTDAKLLEYFDYSLNSKGKLKRASLLYIIYELVGNDAKHKLKYLATSLELLHTASLIHDDIMGNSMIRRGKKCIHEKYGINAALLTTDFLIFNSIKLISDNMGEIVGCKNILSSIMDTFCKLCIGQSLEEKLIANLKVTEKDYYEVVKLKTAVFFSMVCEVSAILADADFETISKFKKLGLSMGMAFQIRDDLLDYSLEKIDSKSKDIDINKRLVTLPIIIAYKKSSKANKYILTTYYSEQRSIETEHIHKVVHESGAYKETIDVIDGYLDRCLEILTGIKKLRGDTLILNKMITDLRVRGELLEGII